MSVEEAAEAVGLSKNTLYQLIGTDSMPYLRFGRTIRIPRSSLIAWMDARAEEHATVLDKQ